MQKAVVIKSTASEVAFEANAGFRRPMPLPEGLGRYPKSQAAIWRLTPLPEGLCMLPAGLVCSSHHTMSLASTDPESFSSNARPVSVQSRLSAEYQIGTRSCSVSSVHKLIIDYIPCCPYQSSRTISHGNLRIVERLPV